MDRRAASFHKKPSIDQTAMGGGQCSAQAAGDLGFCPVCASRWLCVFEGSPFTSHPQTLANNIGA